MKKEARARLEVAMFKKYGIRPKRSGPTPDGPIGVVKPSPGPPEEKIPWIKDDGYITHCKDAPAGLKQRAVDRLCDEVLSGTPGGLFKKEEPESS